MKIDLKQPLKDFLKNDPNLDGSVQRIVNGVSVILKKNWKGLTVADLQSIRLEDLAKERLITDRYFRKIVLLMLQNGLKFAGQ